MIRIHTRDGKTARVDMSDREQAELWINKLKDPLFQSQITGITVGRRCSGEVRCKNCGGNGTCSICNGGAQFSLSRPIGFRKVRYMFEQVIPNLEKKIKGGERIICTADGTRISMMIHSKQLASRTTLTSVGRQTFDPKLDR